MLAYNRKETVGLNTKLFVIHILLCIGNNVLYASWCALEALHLHVLRT